MLERGPSGPRVVCRWGSFQLQLQLPQTAAGPAGPAGPAELVEPASSYNNNHLEWGSAYTAGIGLYMAWHMSTSLAVATHKVAAWLVQLPERSALLEQLHLYCL